MDEERLRWHLANWAAWIRHDDHRLGYPSRASGGIGSTGSREFDAMVATADARCAEAVDAILDDLPKPDRAAVYSIHIEAVWFGPEPLSDVYCRACDQIRNRLDAKGIQ